VTTWIAASCCLCACLMGVQTAAGADCPGLTSLKVDACVQAELDRVDGLLNQIYGVLIKELSAGTDAPDPEPFALQRKAKNDRRGGKSVGKI
jgi:uncharacterized protein YecT (DUF1311 family)